MSRSYKKTPCYFFERKDLSIENRKIRYNKLASIPDGSTFKKIYTTGWNCRCHWTKEQAIQDYYKDYWIQKRYTLNEWLNYYEKIAVRK